MKVKVSQQGGLREHCKLPSGGSTASSPQEGALQVPLSWVKNGASKANVCLLFIFFNVNPSKRQIYW